MVGTQVIPFPGPAQHDNLFKLYFEYVKETEPPVIYHRWALMSAVGAFLSRRYWFPHGHMRVFPNMYVMLIGNPGTRKSSAIKMAKRVLSTAGYSTFAAEKTSKEKFLLDLQGEEHGLSESKQEVLKNLFGDSAVDGVRDHREVFIVADEFNEFVGSGNTEFLSMLGALWDWDDPINPYRQRVKNSKSVELYQPTISIIGGNTHAGFSEAFPSSIIGQGFMSRLVLVYSEPSGKKITFPTPPPENVGKQMTDLLIEMREKVVGPATLSQTARSALDVIYKSWTDLEDSRFKHYSTRRFTHLIKLCLICSAMRLTTEIGVEDVLLANTILSYTELSMPKAMGELGKTRTTEAASKIMEALYNTKTPMAIQQLWKVVSTDLERLTDLQTVLMNLQTADKIQVVKSSEGGTAFLPKQRVISSKSLYVDLKLLKGYEVP